MSRRGRGRGNLKKTPGWAQSLTETKSWMLNQLSHPVLLNQLFQMVSRPLLNGSVPLPCFFLSFFFFNAFKLKPTTNIFFTLYIKIMRLFHNLGTFIIHWNSLYKLMWYEWGDRKEQLLVAGNWLGTSSYTLMVSSWTFIHQTSTSDKAKYEYSRSRQKRPLYKQI